MSGVPHNEGKRQLELFFMFGGTTVLVLCKFIQRMQANLSIYTGLAQVYTGRWYNLHLPKMSIQLIEMVGVNGSCHMGTVQKFILECIEGVYALFLL